MMPNLQTTDPLKRTHQAQDQVISNPEQDREWQAIFMVSFHKTGGHSAFHQSSHTCQAAPSEGYGRVGT
jgi:hypothetical protein